MRVIFAWIFTSRYAHAAPAGWSHPVPQIRRLGRPRVPYELPGPDQARDGAFKTMIL
jgi:hypothetical protein